MSSIADFIFKWIETTIAIDAVLMILLGIVCAYGWKKYEKGSK